MAARALERHLRDACSSRMIDCPLGCGATLAARDATRHATHSCPLRTLRCARGCGRMIAAGAVEAHIDTECPRRLAECPQGCGARVPIDELLRHVDGIAAVRVPARAACAVRVPLTPAPRLGIRWAGPARPTAAKHSDSSGNDGGGGGGLGGVGSSPTPAGGQMHAAINGLGLLEVRSL
jgi:hypothetical protein